MNHFTLDHTQAATCFAWRFGEHHQVFEAVETRLKNDQPVFASLGMHPDYGGRLHQVFSVEKLVPEFDEYELDDYGVRVTLMDGYVFEVFSFIGFENGVDTLFYKPL